MCYVSYACVRYQGTVRFTHGTEGPELGEGELGVVSKIICPQNYVLTIIRTSSATIASLEFMAQVLAVVPNAEL
jgi:hypothetical protein